MYNERRMVMINLELTKDEFDLVRLAVALNLIVLSKNNKPALFSLIRKFTSILKGINHGKIS